MTQTDREAVLEFLETPLGKFGIAVDAKTGQLLASAFTSESLELLSLIPDTVVTNQKTVVARDQIEQAANLLKSYFEGDQLPFSNSLDLFQPGTSFQRAVWAEIEKVPFGKSASYKEVAANTGHPKAHRAAGSACGANRLTLFIPCHRIVGTNGAIGDYRWGSHLKAQLLAHEKSITHSKLGT